MIKTSYLKATFFICLALFSITCKKGSTARVYQGKIFLDDCSTVGIDIDGPAGTGGASAWNGHANAATILNVCLLYDKQVKVGDVIKFSVADNNIEPGSNCPTVLCFAKVNSPDKHIYIYDIEKR